MEKLNEFLVRFDDDGGFQAAHYVTKIVFRDDAGAKVGERLLPARPIDESAPGDIRAFLGDTLAAALAATDEARRFAAEAKADREATAAEAERRVRAAEARAEAARVHADEAVADAAEKQARAEATSTRLAESLAAAEAEVKRLQEASSPGAPARAGDPAAVPASVTAFQAKAALLAVGLLDDVEAAVAAADRLVQIAWASAATFERTSPTIAALAGAIGLDEAALDDLFRAAARITV